MTALRESAIAITAGLLLAACAGVNGGAAADLTTAQLEVVAATRARLAANRADVHASLDDLADSVAFALRRQHGLGANIARARLLEAMRSPWTNAVSTPTQQEVALYQLFALSQAEQAALAARIAAREAQIGELRSAYGSLLASLSALVAAQEQLLASLDRPASAQISLVTQQVLTESRAFRDALDTGDDPRLARLAATVADRERAVAAAEARIVEFIRAIEQE
jgi:hypothetical protein